MHKKIADLFGIFIKSAYICIINKGDKLTSSPLPKFEIVFSSLYKFCEGMFRRETVHSHFFAPNSEVYDVPITSSQQTKEKEHIRFLYLKDGAEPKRTKWDVFSHKRLKKLH